MSVVDCVFLAVAGGSREVGDWLVERVGAEVMVVEGEVVRLRMRGDGGQEWFGVVVQPNGYVVPEPEPEAAVEEEIEEDEPQPYVEGQPTIFEPNPPPAKPKRAPARKRISKPAAGGGGGQRRPVRRKKTDK